MVGLSIVRLRRTEDGGLIKSITFTNYNTLTSVGLSAAEGADPDPFPQGKA